MTSSADSKYSRKDRPWLPYDAVPRALYIHLPFCARLCPYCDFAIARYRLEAVPAYLSALRRELEQDPPPAPLQTVYLGGGTPSALEPPALDDLLGLLGQFADLGSLHEFTIECNPESLTLDKMRLLQDGGVNRFSIGVQSFNDQVLRQLGRHHDGAAAASVVQQALNTGAAVSVDLIFGVPGQTSADWAADLDRLVALGPQHVSLYGLTYEPGTVLTRQRDAGRMAPVGDDAEAAMYRQAIDRLAGAGYEHYEISNFARPDQRSAHNMTYWRGEPYYAAGLGATSYVKGVRAMRERRLPSYLRLIERLGHAIVSAEELDPDARARERLAFGLRLINGIPRSAFEAAVGRDPVEVGGDTLARLQQQGLLDVDTHCVRLTGAGLIIADHVMRELI